MSKIIPTDINKTGGLPAELEIFVGAKVMLRSNIDVKKGLVNGAIRFITKIHWPNFRRAQIVDQTKNQKKNSKKKNSIFKAARLKTGGGRNDEKPLTPLDERILLLIGQGAAEGLDIVDSESMPKVYVIPRVDENPASSTSGTVSKELNIQPYTQEFNKVDFVEYLLPDTLDCVVNVEECNHSASLPLSRTPQSKTP
ncbi:hypothetical protein AVEN_184277-1 [Araneus ventricosus]|uniref:DNA helicase Pif1-like 2B domain-containing protein n=1 Tax=Araneus ventricosus TaxID=182803 RepID=A0A4Y2L3E2_ARAVE|nr:hypothetical protein AVEN_184277-1 [Araneus ventricosus]